MQVSVVLTNGASLKCVPILRALAKHGYEVHVGESVEYAPAFRSKYCSSSFVYPNSALDPDGFFTAVLEKANQCNARAVLPLNWQESLILVKNMDRLPEHIGIPFCNSHKMELLHHKDKMIDLAQSLGIRVPHTSRCCTINELKQAMKKIGFPSVLKPTSSSSSIGVTYHRESSSLYKAFEQLCDKGFVSAATPAILQNQIVGKGAGVSLVMNKGNVIALVSHLRLREFPISGGSSTYRVSITNPAMEKAACRLLSHIKWHGPVMVEFKLPTDGSPPILIEVNPRFWGSVYQAIAAGINVPHLAAQLALKEDISGFFRATPGVRTMCLINELRAIVNSLIHGRAAALGDLIPILRGAVQFDIFSTKDLSPFFWYFLNWLLGRWRAKDIRLC